ncbi:Nucleoid occlusion protein [subsurface metagenome]
MKIIDIKLDSIIDPSFQPRDTLEVEGIEALATSIKEIGLINPIVVRKAGEGYELVAGTRRWHAHKLLGRETIPAKIIAQDSREAAMLQFSENFHRQDLNPIQQARMLKFMLDELGYSTTEIAKFCNRATTWISKSLTLLDMEETTQQAIEQGKLSPSVAMELKLIPDPKLRGDYINYAIEGGCTEKAARDWAHQGKATIAAKEMRQRQAAQGLVEPPPPEIIIPEVRKCALCGAPEDVVVLEQWDICWHCAQKLKPAQHQ